jgi:SAM-dependent methyltransferase
VKTNGIQSIIEFGCGDGNQLALFKVDKYTGVDISKKSIELCSTKYGTESGKSFHIYNPQEFDILTKVGQSDASMSLDVIYHLIEDEDFKKYISDLFAYAKKYVIIYSSNTDQQDALQSQHVRHHKFTGHIISHFNKWNLIKEIKNPFPLKDNQKQESFADFYIFEKQA